MKLGRWTCGFALPALIAVAMFGVRTPDQPAFAAAVGESMQDCPDCAALVVIPRGQFQMGALDGESVGGSIAAGAIEQGTPQMVQPRSDARPRHTITSPTALAMRSFWGTQREFAAFVQATLYQQDGHQDYTGASTDGSAWIGNPLCNMRITRGYGGSLGGLGHIAHRYPVFADDHRSNTGTFRVVRELDASELAGTRA